MVQGRKVLAIDDDPINLDILKEMFPEDEYELILCDTPEQGLDVFDSEAPELVLLDIMMPSISGFEVCRRIRSKYQDRDPIIVMVTGKCLTTDRIEAYKVGANDYITKPFTEEELKLKINYYLNLMQN